MKERNIQSDLVRTVAMFFVIAVHIPLESLGDNLWFNYATRTVFFTCNAMFFMLSGKYNLRFDPKEGQEAEALRSYYSKKFAGIIIPFIIYSVLLYLFEMRESLLDTGVLDLLQDFGYRFFCVNHTTHLWFMYSLVGLLLCAPPIARMLNHLSDFEFNVLMISVFLWNFLKIILFQDILRLPFVFNGWIFEGWVIYFILGFYCDKIQKHIPLFIGLGAAAVVLTTLQKRFGEVNANLWDLSPLYTVAVLGVYLFIERVCVIKSEAAKKLVAVLSRYSFPVYIVHYAVKDYVVTDEKFDVLSMNLSPFALWLIRIVIVFVISFVVAVILDNLLMKHIKKLFNLRGHRLERNDKKI